jgi:hypothetical protein
MSREPTRGRGSHLSSRIAALMLVTMLLLVVCSPAVAMRPPTRAHAPRLDAIQAVGSASARTAALHQVSVRRMVARHTAAAGGGAAAGFLAHSRTHHPVALSAQGALTAGTLAALAAIILVVVAVIAGERRQAARRRRTEEAARGQAAPGRQPAA